MVAPAPSKVGYRIVCRRCKRVFVVHAFPKDLERWKTDTCIQVAMPYLRKDERELFQTQTCGPCWEIMWAKYEDE